MLYGTQYLCHKGELFMEETCLGFKHYKVTEVKGDNITAESEDGDIKTFTIQYLLKGDMEHQYHFYSKR